MSIVAQDAPAGTLTFHQALDMAAALARDALDTSLHVRLADAVALVKDGRVFQAADQAWLVQSATKPDHEYRINGAGCQCEDAVYRAQGKCKHVLAVLLARKSLQLMQAPAGEMPAHSTPVLTEPVPSQPPAPVLPAASLPEAALSVTLKGTIDGQDALLTARGMTAAEFHANLAAIRGLLDPVPALQRQPPAERPEGWCAIHAVQMRRNPGKEGKRDWYSHRHEGQWCKGR